MVDGTRHEFTGMLGTEGPELALRLGDGRSWILRAPTGIERFIGRTVRISGVRHGHIIHVESFGQP